MRWYEIVDDSGVDFNFIRDSRRWIGQIVKGAPSAAYDSAVVIEKPFGLNGWYQCDSRCVKELVDFEVCGCECHTGGVLHFAECCSGPCLGCKKPIKFGMMSDHRRSCHGFYQWIKGLKRKKFDALSDKMKEDFYLSEFY